MKRGDDSFCADTWFLNQTLTPLFLIGVSRFELDSNLQVIVFRDSCIKWLLSKIENIVFLDLLAWRSRELVWSECKFLTLFDTIDLLNFFSMNLFFGLNVVLFFSLVPSILTMINIIYKSRKTDMLYIFSSHTLSHKFSNSLNSLPILRKYNL